MPSLAPDASVCTHGFTSAACSNCSLKGRCLPVAVDMDNIAALEKVIQRSRQIRIGEHLYRSGDTFKSVYVVRSGSIKTYLVDEYGVEQVTGFYFPGEILGFDGIDPQAHGCNVVALEPSSACEIPFDRLEELARAIPSLQHRFFQLMSLQIEADQRMLVALSTMTAKGRIAALLLSILHRNGGNNLMPSVIHLSMSRLDIGNFLGLTIETVSRSLSLLRREGVIDVDGRAITIHNYQCLHELGNGSKVQGTSE